MASIWNRLVCLLCLYINIPTVLSCTLYKVDCGIINYWWFWVLVAAFCVIFVLVAIFGYRHTQRNKTTPLVVQQAVVTQGPGGVVVTQPAVIHTQEESGFQKFINSFLK